MANLAEKLVQLLRINFPKMFYVKLLSSDLNNKDIDYNGSINATIKNHVQFHGENVIGTAGVGPNGTTIVSYSLAAGKKLAIYNINLSSNAKVGIRIGTGVLGAMTDYKQLIIAAAGDINRSTDQVPIIVIDNSAGVVALAVIVYMPNQIEGLGANTNNPVTTYCSAFISGQLV